MQPDITAAKEAAERVIKIWDRTEYDTDDEVVVARALLAILERPEVLVGGLEWESYGLQPGSFAAESAIGCYRVECVSNEWDWRSPGEAKWISCDSLEDGKARCQQDYLTRLAGIWRRG